MVQYKYISADNHIDQAWMPKNLWQDRLPKRLREIGPKVIETPEGSRWTWEGKLHHESADGSLNAKYREQHYGRKGVTVPEGSLPPSDPKILLEHFDRAKMYSAVFYTDPPMWEVQDDELRVEIHRCYNDFLLDLNAHAPNRILGLPALATRHPEGCVAELTRVVRCGAKGVEFNPYDADPPLWHPVWEPLWSAAEEMGIPMCFHIGFREGTPFPPDEYGQLHAFYAVAPFTAALPIAQIVLSGILERHPKLNVSYAECRAGWIPFLVNWMDRQIERRKPDTKVKLKLKPSEYVARQMTFTFEDDTIAARLAAEDWAYIRDSALWGGDYPHSQGVGLNTDEVLDPVFASMDPGLKREILYNRARRIFHIEAPEPAL